MAQKIHDAVKQYFDDIKENNRQIKREISITRTSSNRIVFVDSFLDCFNVSARDNVERASLLQRAFMRKKEVFLSLVKKMINDSSDNMFVLKQDDLTARDLAKIPPDFLVNPDTVFDISPEEAEKIDKAAAEHLEENVETVEAAIQRMLELIDAEDVKPVRYGFCAMRVGGLLDVWDDLINLDRQRKLSLIAPSEKGQPILSFYKAVNDLDSYNNLFPDVKGGGGSGSSRSSPSRGFGGFGLGSPSGA